jgi:hypothetical protein
MLREGSTPDGRDAVRLGLREPAAATAARARMKPKLDWRKMNLFAGFYPALSLT